MRRAIVCCVIVGCTAAPRPAPLPPVAAAQPAASAAPVLAPHRASPEVVVRVEHGWLRISADFGDLLDDSLKHRLSNSLPVELRLYAVPIVQRNGLSAGHDYQVVVIGEAGPTTTPSFSKVLAMPILPAIPMSPLPSQKEQQIKSSVWVRF